MRSRSTRPSTPTPVPFEAIVIQPDGKILIGGPPATARGKIDRLNADGSVDTGFNPPHVTFIGVTVIALQADGKILIGGHFINMGDCFDVCRLNPDGTPDTSFNPGDDGYVWAIAVQADGKILVGGSFTMLGGGGSGTTSRQRIGRLNANGIARHGLRSGCQRRHLGPGVRSRMGPSWSAASSR